MIGRESKDSLYDQDLVTFEEGAVAYDHRDAAGFIKLNALRLRTLGQRRRSWDSDSSPSPARGSDFRDISIEAEVAGTSQRFSSRASTSSYLRRRKHQLHKAAEHEDLPFEPARIV